MPMNSGKELEQLVRDIERSLLPSGFEVSLNKSEFNTEGNQLAEFDIVISGRLGSSPVKWLIECRDRPSQGPAPGSWVEQLVARKARFNFDKVIAVSTTGFAAGISDYAESHGISLRTVQKMADIVTDFNIQEIKYYAHQVTIGPTDMQITSPDLADVDILGNAQFKLIEEIEYVKFPDFVVRHLDGLDLSSISGDACFRFEFECKDGVDVVADHRRLRIHGFVLPLQLDVYVHDGRMLCTNLYSESNEMIGRDVTYIFQLPTGSFIQRVLFLNNFDGLTQSLRIFPPENVPTGYTVDSLQLFSEDVSSFRLNENS
jgi:Restriction endonuclease